MISGMTSVRVDGQFLLRGYELMQGGDFELLGFGDNPYDPDVDQDSTDNGLVGLVRFAGDEPQTVETDESPNTYFHGFAVNGAGVELLSDVFTNTAGIDIAPDGVDRPFGTLYLQRGDIVTGENSVNILEPTPTAGGDLVQAINADEQTGLTDGSGFNAESPVLGGTRNSHIVGTLNRAIQDLGGSTGGFVADGYIYPLGNGDEYRAMVLQLPTDLGATQFFTVTIADDPEIALPDGLTSEAINTTTGEQFNLDLNVQSEPYFNVAFDEAPDEDFNVRVIAGGLSSTAVQQIKQMRLVQFDTEAGSVQEAGTYDFTGDPNDDIPFGPNSFISGVPNIVHEGVDFRQGSVVGLASQLDINPLGTTEDGQQIAGTVTYGGNDGVADATVTATQNDGDTQASATSDTTGAYTITGLPAGNYDVTASVSGEPQGINATDALLAVQGFAGITQLSDFQMEIADVNDSGSVNATDALLIAQFGLGNETSFDAGTFASTTATVDAGAQGVSVQVGAYGDVNLGGGIGSTSSQPALAVTKVSAAASTASAKTSSISSASAPKTIRVPVRVDQDVALGAYSLSIEFPSEKVNFEGLTSNEDVLSRTTEGTVRLAWFDKTGKEPISLSSGETLVTLQFTAADDVENGSTIELGSITGELAGPDASTLSGVGLEVPTVGLGPDAPESFTFDGNYPNPFTTQTQIAFDLPKQAKVSVAIYDMLGRQVMSVPQKSMSAGASRTISLDGSRLGSGVYVYRLQVDMGTETIQETGRMTVVK
jgi:hypothetical protein